VDPSCETPNRFQPLYRNAGLCGSTRRVNVASASVSLADGISSTSNTCAPNCLTGVVTLSWVCGPTRADEENLLQRVSFPARDHLRFTRGLCAVEDLFALAPSTASSSHGRPKLPELGIHFQHVNYCGLSRACGDSDQQREDPCRPGRPRRRGRQNAPKLPLKPVRPYGDYLHLDEILGAQKPPTRAHDEMLFIVQHQVSELWMRLAIHEIDAARRAVAGDAVQAALMLPASPGF
jgi:Tryptophan 2,3-dioxygenase